MTDEGISARKKITRAAGYSVLALSMLIWAAIFVIPWLGLSGGKVAGIITVLVISGEITFYLGIALLGKAIYEKIKSWFRFGKAKKAEETEHKTGESDIQ
jgi:hypothetical protein